MIRSKEELNKLYDEEYFKGRAAEIKHKTEAIRYIAFFDPATVLDYGCGQGIRVHEFVKQGTTAIGYDISKWAVEHPYGLAMGRLYHEEIPNGKYDLITCYDVLEHLEEDEIDKALVEMKARARDAILFSIGMLGDPNLDHDPTHVTKKSRQWWETKLKNFGFTVTDENKLKTFNGLDYFLYPEQIVICRVKNNEKNM